MLDSDLLAQLLDRYAAALELFASQWSSCPADVVQEAFVDLIRLPEPPPHVKPWLFRAVRNRAINSWRAEVRRKKHEGIRARLADSWFQTAPDNDLNAAEVQTALQQLPASQREVIVARIWGDLTFQEIAAVTDRSTSTAHRLFENGIRTLQRRFTSCTMTSTAPRQNSSQ